MTNDQSAGLGRFFQEAAKLPLLTSFEEVEFSKRIQRGDRTAVSRMVEHNIRLAINISKRYRNRGVPFEDLVQEGMLGLIRAAEKFDWKKGYKFSTYASWWINHFLQRVVANSGSTIRAPGHVTARRAKIRAHLQNNPDATRAELAEAGGCREDQIDDALDLTRVVASLDTMSEDDGSAYDTMVDPNSETPDELVIGRDARLRGMMSQLPAKERRVLELRFGFDGPPQGRKAVSEAIGESERDVAALQKLGMARLRSILGDIRPGVGRAKPLDGSSIIDQSRASRDLTPVCSRTEPQ